MTGTSARGATLTDVHALSEPDLQLGIAEIKNVSAVTTWVRHGKPVEDIETEVGNVINGRRFCEPYKALRNRMCSEYKIDEREFVRQLFQRMTRR